MGNNKISNFLYELLCVCFFIPRNCFRFVGMYRSFDISKKILSLAKRDGMAVDPMKLLKLVYISHGYYLAFFNKPLITDEIQAWKYGPVIPSLYHVIKRYGSSSYVDLEHIEIYSEKEVNKEDSHFLESFWNSYKKYSGLQLSDLTHRENTPWSNTYRHGEYYSQINDETIKEYYLNKISDK